MEDLLCHICGKMFSHMDTLKRHLGSHSDSKFNCLNFKYSSPRKDALKRHSKTHKTQPLLSNSKDQSRPEKKMKANETRLETKAYQVDLTNTNSSIYQQSLSKNKEIFLWILHKLDTQPRNSRPYYQPDPINIPLETNELLQDPRETRMNLIELSLSNEIDHILNQEYMISASLSELDIMLRNMESEDIPLSSTEEETNAKEEDAWITLDSIWTMIKRGYTNTPPSYKLLKIHIYVQK